MEKFGLFKLLSQFLPTAEPNPPIEAAEQKPNPQQQTRKIDKTQSYISFLERHAKHSAAAKKNK